MPKAMRLTFEYAGLDQPRVISATPLQKRVVTSDRRESNPNRSGFWFDVLHDSGEVLYRRVTSDPRLDLDAPSDDDGRMASAVPPDRGEFSVVLPVLPGGSRMEIWASRGGERSQVLLSAPFPREPG